MIEVLLQADRALASGALDQAERSYWQLVELDPTNAIAVTGLARVSLERGDTRLARTFAERALTMDPDSGAARRILERLITGEAPPPEEPDLPLLAAQRLEALGRRRLSVTGDADSATRPERGRGRQDPDATSGSQFPQLPNEPLSARRQAGRDAAAAAAAAAEGAPRSKPAARAKAHQALGDRARRRLNPDAIKVPPRSDDPFAAAESAAAVEAVGETDEIAVTDVAGTEPVAAAQVVGAAEEAVTVSPTAEPEAVAEAAAEPEAAAEEAVAEPEDAAEPEIEPEAAAEPEVVEWQAPADALEAVGEDHSIAPRIALVSPPAGPGAADMGDAEFQAAVDEADLDAAEQDAAPYQVAPADEPARAELDAAGMDAAEPDAADMDAAELEAAEAAVVNRLGMREDAVGVEDLDAAELDVEMLAGRRTGARGARIDLDAIEAELAAAELRAGGSASVEPALDLEESGRAALAAAERAAELAAPEFDETESGPSAAAAAEPADEFAATEPATTEPATTEPATPSPSAFEPEPDASAGQRAAVDEFDGYEQTEEEAEAAAFREALDVLLGGETAESASPDASPGSPALQRPIDPASPIPPQDVRPSQTEGAAGDGYAHPDIELPAPEKSSADGRQGETPGGSQPRRKGLFGRFRGD